MSAEAWRRSGHLDAAAFCVTGVALSAPQARFARQAWHVQYLHRCPRKLGDELVTWTPLLSVWLRSNFSTSSSICVAGMVLSVPTQHVRLTHRCPRKLGDELVTWTPLLSVWLARHFQHIRLNFRGRRGTFSTYIDVRGSLATNWSLGRRCFLCGWRDTFSTSGSICVAGVVPSVPT